MKTRIWLAVIITFGMISCDKDKFETVPQLEYKSRNTDIVPVNGSLRLNVEFRDKEGDVSDSVLIVRQRLNKRGPVQLPANPYGIPDFPKTDKGEFEITLEYQFHLRQRVFFQEHLHKSCKLCWLRIENEKYPTQAAGSLFVSPKIFYHAIHHSL